MKLLMLTLVPAVAILGFATQSTPTDQKLSEKFLSEADKILSEDPTDGNFGLGRLPTMHGRQYFDNRKPAEKACVEAWEALGKSNRLALVSWGQFNANNEPQRSTTMSGHYTLNHGLSVAEARAHLDSEDQFHKNYGPTEASKLYKSGKKTATASMPYAGTKAMIELRAVFPTNDKCLGCHAGVPKGKPIGIMGLIRVPKA